MSAMRSGAGAISLTRKPILQITVICSRKQNAIKNKKESEKSVEKEYKTK